MAIPGLGEGSSQFKLSHGKGFGNSVSRAVARGVANVRLGVISGHADKRA